MKNLFFLLAATLMLTSCTKDATCTCTVNGDAGLGIEDVVTTTSCTGCNGSEMDDFEAACADAATIAANGPYGGDCVID